jgi:carbohydrate kinase (thermoresistant glucokinase family)
MGVSGSGKSTVGQLLADALELPFLDGDDLHPAINVAKMASGVPLNDNDRWPWLDRCADAMLAEGGSVLACSALKRSYRDKIRETVSDVIFVHLDGSKELLLDRLANRTGHFMKKEMLVSQLATLQKLEMDEAGFVFDVSLPEQELVEQITEALRQKN